MVQVLLYHVFGATVTAADLTDGMILAPLGPQGATLTVAVDDGMVVFLPSSGITDAVVVSADVPVPGTDVVIHVIDQVLVPLEVVGSLL